MHEPILSIRGLTKTYKGGTRALDSVDLDIRRGEIFALLGPNGAGKTTLIGAVCGLVRPTAGTITAFGQDLSHDWRKARARIGLVPQELATDMFETVSRAVAYSRGLFGKPSDPAMIEDILRSLSLWDKRDAQIRALEDDKAALVAERSALDLVLGYLKQSGDAKLPAQPATASDAATRNERVAARRAITTKHCSHEITGAANPHRREVMTHQMQCDPT